MAKTAAIYTRILGDLPNNEDNRTAVQIMKCKDYCRQNGFLVREDYIFSESRPSIGHDGHRPSYEAMMDLAMQHPPAFQAIVVVEYNRFMRDRDLLEMAQGKLLGNGVRLYAIKDGSRTF